MGDDTESNGNFGATAMGSRTEANGDFGSTATGLRTISNGNSCTVVGLYNDTLVAAKTVITSASPIFIVGNGDFGIGNESNAMVVRKNGIVGIGADPSIGQLAIKQRTAGDGEGLRLISNADNKAWELRYTGNGDNLRIRVFADNGSLDHTVEIRRSDGGLSDELR